MTTKSRHTVNAPASMDRASACLMHSTMIGAADADFQLKKARAAVSELIEADKEFDAANLSGDCIRKGNAAVRRHKALAALGAAL